MSSGTHLPLAKMAAIAQTTFSNNTWRQTSPWHEIVWNCCYMKTSDVFGWDNYIPVHILPSLSKTVEKIHYMQLYIFFSDILSTILTVSSKYILTRLFCYCKQILDEGFNVDIILMEMSK